MFLGQNELLAHLDRLAARTGAGGHEIVDRSEAPQAA